MGKNCRELVEELGIEINPYYANVHTASGNQCRILRKIITPVTCKNRTENILLYLCPDLEQNLYLGVDFWRAFELAPYVMNADGIEHFETGKEKMHVLSHEQKKRLEAVVEKFPSFEKNGLGCTKLEKHVN